MNKWKIGFWICVTLLVTETVVGLYSIVDQGVSLTYLQDSCNDIESDLNTIVELINDTDLTKDQIKEKLKSHDLFEYMDFNRDEIHIKQLTLYFKDDRLKVIRKE